MRDAAVVDVDAEAVVPGDLLVLVPGTRVPADARVTESRDLGCDESALTGESVAADKSAGDVIYAGTITVAGQGEAEVTATAEQRRIRRPWRIEAGDRVFRAPADALGVPVHPGGHRA